MWRLFQRQHPGMQESIAQISPADLSSMLVHCSDKLIIFDLREHDEIELYPYVIPGALPTTNVILLTLIPSIPPRSAVVLYAADQTLNNYSLLRLRGLDSKFYVLNGGLRAWWEAHLPLESVRCPRGPSPVSRSAWR